MIEQRGIRCQDCTLADFRSYPDHAKCGYARCTLHEVVVFVRFEARRNCKAYDQADAKVVAKREKWASSITLPAWQR